MELPTYGVVLGCVTAALLIAYGCFHRFRLPRPPVGVINLGDVAIILGGVVAMPFLYLALPAWLVVALLALGLASGIALLAEGLLGGAWAGWLVAAVLVGLDLAAVRVLGADSPAFRAINDAVIVLGAVGAANLWAQAGMRARDLAILAAALMLYDFTATAQLPLMAELLGRLADLPLAPLVAWDLDRPERALGVGLGDLLLATVGPLVLRKAFGRAAGLVALLLALGSVAALLALPALGARGIFPAMVVLGPLIVLQYAYWHQRCGAERTTQQYLRAEPLPARRRSTL
jgi:hypothetical protein